jgi:hypothetical protein
MRTVTSRSIAPVNRLGSRAAYKAVNRRQTRRMPAPVRWLVLFLIIAFVVGCVVLYRAIASPVVLINGIAEGQLFRRNQLADLVVVATANGPGTDGLSMRIDGTELPLERNGDIYIARPKDLAAGQHVLLVSANGFPLKSASVSRTFTVDLSGPRLVLPARVGAPATQPVILTGVAENAVTVTVEGQQVPVVRGRFDVGLVSSDRVVNVLAVDQHGVAESGNVTITTQPVAPTQPARRGVHITSTGWADPALRNAVLDLARQKRIDAVELDVKDEGGVVGYASQVALANEIGATTQSYDAAATVAELKGLGVRVVGRIVNFLDPKLAAHSLAAGRMDELILNADGSGPYQSGYGAVAFTNFASPAVRQYNIDLAVEATKLGFDEILFDYVRRPDGAIETMTIPGLTVDPAIGVADFVRATRAALTGMPVTLGISVFGISATRPEPIAQDMRLLLPWVDYIAPMVYPSHWGPGEYGLANPNANPYEIVKRSLTDFHAIAYGSGVAVLPWLQAFSAAGIDYGPDKVMAQVQAAAEVGSPGFLLWNSGSAYDPNALPPLG